MADEISAVQAIKKFSGQHQTRLRWWLAYAGDGNGNVYTSQANYYLCRYPLTSSPAVEIYNNRIGLVDGLRIIVGYTAYQPNLLQVLDVADQRLDGVDPNDNPINPGDPGYVSVLPHWVNHQYLGSDSGLINFRQLSPLGVFPNYPADLNVRIWPGTIPRPGADVNVSYQLLDLTASIPPNGARYTLISFDSTGAVVATDGTINVGGFAALTNADIPDTPAGNWRSCAVVLYDGQTAIVETTTEVDFLDLRFPEEQSAGIIPLTNTHILVGNASNIATDVALSSDATIANTGALTLATVNSTVGTFGDESNVPQVTVNAKGLITAAVNVPVLYPFNIYNEIQIATGGATYYLANVAVANTVRAYDNGIRQPVGEDDTNSDVVTFSVAPTVGNTLIFDYEAEIT